MFCIRPPKYRGRGVAASLCKVGFAYAAHEQMSVRPSCTYVSDAFLRKEPQFSSQLEEIATTVGGARAAVAAQLKKSDEDALRKMCTDRDIDSPRGGKAGMIHRLASLSVAVGKL
jgi:hypothetical protein